MSTQKVALNSHLAAEPDHPVIRVHRLRPSATLCRPVCPPF